MNLYLDSLQVYLPIFLKSNIYESYQIHLKKTLQHTEDVKSCSSRSSISLEDHVPLVIPDAPPRSPTPILEKTESKLNLFEETNLEDFWFKPQSMHSDLRFVFLILWISWHRALHVLKATFSFLFFFEIIDHFSLRDF